GKVVSNIAHVPYMIVGTAPSMDGYASGTSSVIRDGLKYSLTSKCPEIVIGDLDVLKAAPMRMIQAGVGDLFAKFVSIGEWKISNIINGEYYCQYIADLVNFALKTCLNNIDGIAKRDEKAISSVMEGMVLSGIAANYAEISRPVSGMEHYISHICDMRGVEFNMHTDFHGIQCGVGTVIVLKLYEYLRTVTPDREKALDYVNNFDYEEWKKFLRKNIGNSAEAMIENEEKEGKYDVEKHKERLEIIIKKWDEIENVIHAFPTAEEVVTLLKKIGAPTTFEEIGFTKDEEKNAILMSKDIRDKYVCSRLLWDLGLLDEIK
ncbi:MAG: iron-containing alcohol dehydrogenase, partial [Clostridia bacterium]|nr:iron-containing alcohol dehydrogenase [Clostridia bacterium]